MEFQAEALMWALLATSSALWIHLLYHWKQAGWPLPFRLRRAVPWSPIEAVFVIVIVLFVVAAGLQQIFLNPAGVTRGDEPTIKSSYSLRMVQVQSISQVVELALIPLVLSLWHLCYWADYGIWRRDWKADIQAGVWGVLLAILPVQLLNYPFHALRSENPHPLLELLQNSVGDRQTLLWVVVQVVILAPLIEELLFRVILQGALSRESPPYLAILLSSATFVCIHQPVDWAPLFPLALVLGYVYYRRQSFLAVVLLHGLFNGLNLILLFSKLSPDVPSP